jgi:hypothetical protein
MRFSYEPLRMNRGNGLMHLQHGESKLLVRIRKVSGRK